MDETKQPIQRVDSPETVTRSPGRVTERTASPDGRVSPSAASEESEFETVTLVVTDMVSIEGNN